MAHTPSALETNLGQDEARLEKVRWAQDHPWGTPENHPGAMGKLAHVFSSIGNIAGNIVAPGVMANIPGTEMSREVEEGRLSRRTEGEQHELSEEGLQGAQKGHLEEETNEMPGKTQSEEELQGALTKHLGAETNVLEHPPEAWKAIPGVIGPNGEPVEIEAKSGQVRFGGVQGASQLKQPRPDTPEQQYIDEYQRMHKGSTIGQAERAYTLDTQRPPQVQPIMMMVPNPNGGATAQVIRPGQEVSSGATTASQYGSQQIPTNQMRNMGEMATTVQPQMDAVMSEVQQLASQLGPAVGRWNQLMVNKGGADHPEFAGLDTDLDLLASAIVRTHFGARGGQGYREELRKQFGEAQSPQDLIARIQHAEGWIKGYAAAGKKTGGAADTASGVALPRPANVPEGYSYNANGPKGAGWYAPAAK